jgi:dihydroxyacetone kinase
MALAARAARSALDAGPDLGGEPLVTKLATAMGSVGGAIGPIYAVGLLAIAKEMRAEQASGSPTVAQLATWAEAAESAVMAMGQAQVGDKTVIDALDPVVRSLEQSNQSAVDLETALDRAAAAAQEGADSTADMVAKIGRASRLGDRSRGLPDPGATSLALILRAFSAATRAGSPAQDS